MSQLNITEDAVAASEPSAWNIKIKSWNAAMFECRGWTVIVAGNKTTGGYALVWAEPAKGGSGLNSIYFENDGHTLDLVYYKAKRMSKVKISMANASVKRQK